MPVSPVPVGMQTMAITMTEMSNAQGIECTLLEIPMSAKRASPFQAQIMDET